MGGNNFNTRVAVGELFSQEIFSDLLDWGFDVALNGTEHTHPDFVKLLNSSIDTTSLMIRFQPDGVISYSVSRKTAYVEAKKSKYIEKNAYKNYMRLYDLGCEVYVVFGIPKPGDAVKAYCKIQDLEFEPLPELCNFPIIDGWICPREHPNWQEIKFNGFPGSGTPYREISQNVLIPWFLFKSIRRGNDRDQSGIFDKDGS